MGHRRVLGLRSQRSVLACRQKRATMGRPSRSILIFDAGRRSGARSGARCRAAALRKRGFGPVSQHQHPFGQSLQPPTGSGRDDGSQQTNGDATIKERAPEGLRELIPATNGEAGRCFSAVLSENGKHPRRSAANKESARATQCCPQSSWSYIMKLIEIRHKPLPPYSSESMKTCGLVFLAR